MKRTRLLNKKLIDEFFDIETIIAQLKFCDICICEPGRSVDLRIYAGSEDVIRAVEQTLLSDINIAEQVKDMFCGCHIVCFLENESFFYRVVRHFTVRYYHPYYEGDGVMTLMGLMMAEYSKE